MINHTHQTKLWQLLGIERLEARVKFSKVCIKLEGNEGRKGHDSHD